jgi:hypothetical protein
MWPSPSLFYYVFTCSLIVRSLGKSILPGHLIEFREAAITSGDLRFLPLSYAAGPQSDCDLFCRAEAD